MKTGITKRRRRRSLHRGALNLGAQVTSPSPDPPNLHRTKHRAKTTRPRAFMSPDKVPIFGMLSTLHCSVCARTLASHVSTRGRLMDCAYAMQQEPQVRETLRTGTKG